jgi:DinB superfamily
MNEDLRYPIGEFRPPAKIDTRERLRLIDELAAAPALLRRAVEGLSSTQLDTPYRSDGWTVRQLVHHVPDSHLNGYMRMKLALTETLPIIKPYNQEDWARVTDLRVPIDASLRLLEGLHELWAGMLRSLSDDQWQRGFIHPELIGPCIPNRKQDQPWRRGFISDERGIITVEGVLPTYAWHGRHHIAHIAALCKRKGWNQAG